MGKWRFVPDRFNGEGEYQQLGSIWTPEGYYFCAVESQFTMDGYRESDLALVEQIVKVLNRELPEGKPRNRKGKK